MPRPHISILLEKKRELQYESCLRILILMFAENNLKTPGFDWLNGNFALYQKIRNMLLF